MTDASLSPLTGTARATLHGDPGGVGRGMTFVNFRADSTAGACW